MKKQLLVHLTEEEHEFLRVEAFETGQSMAGILREGLELYKNQKGATTMTNKKIDYGTIIFDGKEYELQEQAEITSRLLPDIWQVAFEMTALAIGEDNRAYEVSWVFEDDGRELDEYDYTEVYSVQPADVPVYTVQMVRGTEGAWDETHEDAEVIFRTLDLKEAIEKMEQTHTVELDSYDLEGNRYFLAPALISVWGEDSTILD